MIPAVGKSGAGTSLIRSSTVLSGFFSRARHASTTSQVVRRDIGRHSHGYSGGAVDKKVRDLGRQDRGFPLLAVVVRNEVDGFLLDIGEYLGSEAVQAAFGIPVGRGRIPVDRAEVALPVDQRIAHREVLGHANQGLVGGGVAMRVIFPQ